MEHEINEGNEPQNQTAPAAPDYDPNQLVPVINTEARIYALAWTAPGEPNIDPVSGLRNHVPRETGKVVILPGLNFIRWGELARVDFQAKLPGFKGSVYVKDPTALVEFEAAPLAGYSASGRALRHWLSIEQRAPVRAAIQARLQHQKFRNQAPDAVVGL